MTRASRRLTILGGAGWSMLASWLAWPATAEVKMENPRVAEAARLMTAYAERTGLDPEGPGKRYLWTDAFAVCNFLGLAGVTGEERYRGLALRLVDRVHHTLGRHRADDSRKGWLSGLDDRRAEEHPTLGGLRIGKELPERRPQDRFDERLEWDRDGQYFHYLTRWMHALDVVARATHDPRFNVWGRELAAAAHDAFSYDPPGSSTPRMAWKMSIDLERPLVPSMGLHDPLEGLVAVLELETTAAALDAGAGPDLRRAASRFAAMIEGRDLATTDPLGLGGLLMDAHRLDRLLRDDVSARTGILSVEQMRALRLRLLEAALSGLAGYVRESELERPASTRLAFRELGLAIGLAAVERMAQDAAGDRPLRSGGAAEPARVDAMLQRLARFVPLGDRIEDFWLAPEHRAAATWREHLDINEVMLATRLEPSGCLALPPVAP